MAAAPHKTHIAYCDSPEGEDCFYKIYWTSRVGLKFGFFFGAADVLLHSHPIGASATALRFASTAFPFVLAPATFSVVACAATNLRKKDDHYNFILAGACAGGAFGRAWGSKNVAMGLGFMGAVLGMLMKDAMLNNWHFGGGRELDFSPFLNKRLYTTPSSQRED